MGGESLAVGVLGPLTVSVGGAPVAIPSLIQRNLVGFLALRPGYAVPVDEIAELLWPGDPPPSWRNLIHVHVNRLRGIIEPARGRRVRSRILVSLNGSYRLDLDPEHLDAARFDRAAGQARRASAQDPLRACLLYEQALECWRGPVLAGSDDHLCRHPAAQAWQRRRVEVATAYAEIALACDRHAQAKRWLLELSDEEPLHERLHAQLMVALAGSGEQAAALRVFTGMRGRLAEQLGVDPGPQMREAYQRVLIGAPAAGVIESPRKDVVPLQVPAIVPAFLGRDAELRRLDELAVPAPAPQVGIVCGTAGVGKTAMVAHWAHRAAARFPDGQLYADLRGFDPLAAPMEPAEALRSFLRALGVTPGAIPAGAGEAAALFRSVLAGRRMLVVLDNAHSVEQVLPLLPGSATCTVVVTSRNRLTGLIAGYGARILEVAPLPPEHAVELLRALLGERAGDADQAADLARHCAHLPLALRIAAANLAGRPHLSVTDVVDRLAGDDALSALATLSTRDGQRFEVKAAFSLSYRGLEAPARRLFRLLHLIPAPDFGVYTAAALLGETAAVGLRLLEALGDGHIVTETKAGRYALHDLLRHYSRACAVREETEEALECARRRLVDFYSVALHEAYLMIQSRRNETPRVLRFPPVQTPVFAGRDATLGWLDQERVTLVAVVTIAAEHGWDEPVWQLADSLFAYFHTRRLWPEWDAVLRLGFDAARRLGDGRATARMLNALGVVAKQTGRYEQARAHYEAALGYALASGYSRLVAALHSNLAGLLIGLDDLDAAMRHALEALKDEEYGYVSRFATVTYLNYGCILLERGDLDAAALAQSKAFEHAIAADDPVNAAMAHHNLTEISLLRGDLPAAAGYAASALTHAAAAGDPLCRAAALDSLGSCHAAGGDLPAAMAAWREALEIYRSLGHRLQHQLSRWLEEISGGDGVPPDLPGLDGQRRQRARKMI